jgi:mono/diheme cytochrome c family protein
MMTMKSRIFTSLAALVCLSGPALAQDDQDLISRGAYVARLGDCVACHSTPGGTPYAGGRAIVSDLGTIFSTNITPDPKNGIGGYTQAQFTDAVRHGVRADGAHLYPAMPYPSYAKISDDDMHALYAFFMKGVQPVAQASPETDLGFPFNQRWGMIFWNAVFSSSTAFAPDATAADAINRGAYLVEGLGHCGSCHTERGLGMQETAYDASSKAFLAGGNLNGWSVPSLRAKGDTGPGIARWSEQDIVDYLAEGRNRFAAVGGEMKDVVAHSSSFMNDQDLHAIASYLKTLAPAAPEQAKPASAATETAERLAAAKNLTLGERVYIDNCGACHFVDGKGGQKIFPELDGASIVNGKSPVGLVTTILDGAATPTTPKGPSVNLMPGFANRLSNAEIAALATFVRSAWSNSAGAVSDKEVGEIRAHLETGAAH